MPSQNNFVLIQGHILHAPVVREDGHVEATLQNHEKWTDKDGTPQSRENMLGIIALPGGRPAARLLQMGAGTTCHILGSLRTTHTTGPRGGSVQKTKIQIRRILTEH